MMGSSSAHELKIAMNTYVFTSAVICLASHMPCGFDAYSGFTYVKACLARLCLFLSILGQGRIVVRPSEEASISGDVNLAIRIGKADVCIPFW